MRRPLLLCLALTALLLSACGDPPVPPASEPGDSAGPPLEQIPGDFDQAEWVAEVRVVEVVPDAGIPGDGSPDSYVVCVVRSVVNRAHKAPGNVPAELEYRFTAEGRCTHFPAPGQRLVVFLRTDPATGQLWQLAEGAQLPATPAVVEQVRAVASAPRG